MKPTDLRNAPAGQFFSHGDGGHHHYTAAELHNDDVAHEESDINIPALIWSAVILTTTCVFAATLVYVLFWHVFLPLSEKQDPRVSPLAMPATAMPTTTTTTPEFGSAPQPRLLTNEPTFLRGLRESEQQTLEGYGWVDEKAGVARVPIDEAKKLLLKQGLPVRPEPVADPHVGTHLPAFGESSSGRAVTQSR
jgi:hypothetical protein